MKKVLLWVVMTVVTLPCAGAITAAWGEWDWREDGEVIAGVETGVVIPLNALRRFTETGGMFSPYLGFMFKDQLPLKYGLTGQVQLFGMPKQTGGTLSTMFPPKKDNSWVVAYLAGPRLGLVLGEIDNEFFKKLNNVELWITGQAGGLSAINSAGPIRGTSFGISTGGGIDLRLTEQWTVGAFMRWNWADHDVYGIGEVRYLTTGLNVMWNTAPPAPPPPPPPPPEPEEVVIEEVEEVRKIVLRGVHFDFDKYNIRPDAEPILDEAIEILTEEGGIAVICEGHTNGIGTAEYNMGLSLRRAQAVRDYLVQGGIEAQRIEVEGFGLIQPVASNDTSEGRAQNRRVELRIVGD